MSQYEVIETGFVITRADLVKAGYKFTPRQDDLQAHRTHCWQNFLANAQTIRSSVDLKIAIDKYRTEAVGLYGQEVADRMANEMRGWLGTGTARPTRHDKG